MSRLKQFDTANLVNGSYISMEREYLVQSKVDNDTVDFKRTLKNGAKDLSTL